MPYFFINNGDECQSPQGFKPEGASRIALNAALCLPIPERIHYIESTSSSLRLTHLITAHGSYLAACFGFSSESFSPL